MWNINFLSNWWLPFSQYKLDFRHKTRRDNIKRVTVHFQMQKPAKKKKEGVHITTPNDTNVFQWYKLSHCFNYFTAKSYFNLLSIDKKRKLKMLLKEQNNLTWWWKMFFFRSFFCIFFILHHQDKCNLEGPWMTFKWLKREIFQNVQSLSLTTSPHISPNPSINQFPKVNQHNIEGNKTVITLTNNLKRNMILLWFFLEIWKLLWNCRFTTKEKCKECDMTRNFTCIPSHSYSFHCKINWYT